MFEQTFIDEPGRGVKPWALALSLAVQASVVAAAVLIPLVFTYELPVTEWLERTLLVPPPPAPPPRAPVAAQAGPKLPSPARFDAFVAPNRIPENVALLGEDPLAGGLTAPDLGAIQGGVPGGLEGGVLGAAVGAAYVPELPIRVGGQVQAAKVLTRVSPEYPAAALEQQISGSVRLEAIITTRGTVRDIKVLSGEPILATAAVTAVQQWRYEPTFLNKRPVEVVTVVDVRFAIAEPVAPVEPPEQNNRRRRRTR